MMRRPLGTALVALVVLAAGALLAGGVRPRRALPATSAPAAAAPASPASAVPAPVASPTVPHRDVQTQPNAFFDGAQFGLGLRAGRAHPAPALTGTLVGGLVPHHILASTLLATFWQQLEAQPPHTVIVVGPNHPARGQRIITGRRGWATDFGVVEADNRLIDALVATGLVTVDDETLSEEHSEGAEMPYIKYHAPQATVVPLILHKDVKPEELARLIDVLAPHLGKDCILVASMDFSHYLTRVEAEAKDPESLAAIRSHDLATLWAMGPDHLDSPPSVGMLLLAMQRLGLEQPEILGHTNSGYILQNDATETTSYFVFRYQRP